MYRTAIAGCWLLAGLVTDLSASAQTLAAPPRDDAVRALKKAATYYHDRLASHGGYVYYYSLDLSQRWGEGRVARDTIFVQPPGTPTVGMALLKAHAATGDKFYLQAAREAARALVAGQLQSGGWTQAIHFSPPEGGRMGKYRKGKSGSWNNSSLDDGQTQAALQCLIRTDAALGFQDAEIHEAAGYGLNALRNAQFPNGAFPQVWTGPVSAPPVRRAQYPTYDWRTEGRLKNYWDYYTLNDGVAGTVADVLILAHQIYGDPNYESALKQLGEFLILAQMPDPQPGWCQQYNYDMVPIWARKFEPPAVTAWESQDVIETLMKIAQYTNDRRYLEPIPRALQYFTSQCRLPGGQVARYYELKTNQPLYMDSSYQLTYDDSSAPEHYGWNQADHFDALEQAYRAAREGTRKPDVQPRAELEREAGRIIQALDDQGRWVSTYAGERLVGQPGFKPGFLYLSSEVFSRNVELLSEYVRRGANSPAPPPNTD